MPTLSVNLSTLEYVKVNTALNPMILQAHNDSVRITISEFKPSKSNPVFHLVGGNSAPLHLNSVDTNIWALATTDDSSLIVSETRRLPVDTGLQLNAFSELLVSELTPIMNVEFNYNLHEDLVTTKLNKGSASIDSNRLKLSTGAVANQSAQLLTRIPIKYHGGIGARARFSALFTLGVINSTQVIGVGDSGDGYFFGYDGSAFGILKRNGGVNERRSIQITTKSTTAENITITLDGDADVLVAVTDASSGDVTTTANDIAAHDFSHLGGGWIAVAIGDIVEFTSFKSGAKSETYSLSGASTAIGVSSQILAGVAKTDNWTPQASWNNDRFDGSDISGVTLDPTKGNIYQIKYQWLGFGLISFYIENPNDGASELVHSIKYANSNELPIIDNPNLPICAFVENTTNTTDIALYSSSLGGFIEGKKPTPQVKHVIIQDKTFSSTTIAPVITIHNSNLFQGKKNRIRMKINSISVEIESGKPAIIEVFKNATLTSASFSIHSENKSVAKTDNSAISQLNGELLDAFTVSSGTSKEKNQTIYVEPDETITISGAQASSGANSVSKVIVNWEEDF